VNLLGDNIDSINENTKIVIDASKEVGLENWLYVVKFDIFMAVTMKNAIFWDVAPCGSCKNQRFRGM
jgi:hypothetical protein